MLDQQRVLAEFGEFALRAEDLDGILNEACRLVAEGEDVENEPFLISEESIGTDDRPEPELILRGFPSFASTIEYEAQTLRRQAHVFGARLVGASP